MNSPRTTRKLRDAGSFRCWILLFLGTASLVLYFTLLKPPPPTLVAAVNPTSADLVPAKMSASCIVSYAPDSDFPIQNLPYGVFSPRNALAERHIGVAIGVFLFCFVVIVNSNGSNFFHFFFFFFLFLFENICFFKKKGDSILDLTVASELGLIENASIYGTVCHPPHHFSFFSYFFDRAH